MARGRSRSLKMAPFDRPYNFLLVCRCKYIALYCIISEIKRAYWSKIAIFLYPLHSTLPLRGFPSVYYHTVWYEKLEWSGYPKVKNFDDMFSRFNRIPACDRRTDRQISCHDAVRAMRARRAVKSLSAVYTGGPYGSVGTTQL